MSEHDTLGLAGCSRGVNDRRQIVRAAPSNQLVESRRILLLDHCTARFNTLERHSVLDFLRIRVEQNNVFKRLQSFESLARMLEHAASGNEQGARATVCEDE